MKRILDIILALIAFIFAFIPALILVVIASIQFGKPFFIQHRVGKNEAIFSIYKIRSLGNHHELSPFWSKIRSLGLDEIPQCWNILKGDMSWVGPRPLLPEYLQHYSPEQRQRHSVLPGIFGWSQLKQMQVLLSWEERLALDIEYLKIRSVLTDAKIFLRSVFIIFTKARKNASDFERFGS